MVVDELDRLKRLQRQLKRLSTESDNVSFQLRELGIARIPNQVALALEEVEKRIASIVSNKQ